MINKALLSLFLTATLPLFSSPALAAENLSNIENGIALQGYDAIAYFSESALKGSEQFNAQYDGATYYFISMGNRDIFIQSPEEFLPEYGGWCAYAMLDGDTVNVDPESFKIVEGKLFLFYDGFWGDTLKKWNKLTEEQLESELITSANRQWNELNE